jgi:hypothetical protein
MLRVESETRLLRHALYQRVWWELDYADDPSPRRRTCAYVFRDGRAATLCHLSGPIVIGNWWTAADKAYARETLPRNDSEWPWLDLPFDSSDPPCAP